MSSNEDQQSKEIFEMMVQTGAIELYGVHEETGEALYRVTNVYKEMFPDMYAIHMAELGNTVNLLWQKGLLEIDFTDREEKVSFHAQNFLKYIELKGTLNQEELDILHVFFPKEETE